MIKKTILLAGLIALFTPCMYASYSTTTTETTLKISEDEKLPLKIKIDEKEMIGKPDKKGIISIPNVILQDNLLRFITPCNGCTFRLVQDNNICYEIEIIGNTLAIPTAFTGMYELQIVSGEYIFWCEIEL